VKKSKYRSDEVFADFILLKMAKKLRDLQFCVYFVSVYKDDVSVIPKFKTHFLLFPFGFGCRVFSLVTPFLIPNSPHFDS